MGNLAQSAAQLFSWDFAGIVDVDPVLNMSALHLEGLWRARIARDVAGGPLFTPADVELLRKAVLARCDLDDGLKDGIISNPRSCEFEPGELACPKEQNTGFFSPEQVLAIVGGAVSMVDARDAAHGVCCALTEPGALGRAFNIAAAEPTTHDQGASVVSELFGVPKRIVKMPITWRLDISIEASTPAHWLSTEICLASSPTPSVAEEPRPPAYGISSF